MGDVHEEKRVEEKKEEDAAAEAKPEDGGKKKRTADRQINKDDAPEGFDGEESLNQPFHKASEEVLSRRKILKVKRPTTDGTAKPASNNPFAATKLKPTSSSPFAATKLTTSIDSKSSDSSSKVFGGGSAFSGFGGFGSSSNTSEGFGSSSSSGGGFGSAFGSSSGFGTKASSESDAAKTSAPATSLFGKPTGSPGFSFGFAKPTTKESESASSATVTLPENVKLTTGEEDEVKMHEVRCKSFKLVTQAETKEVEERKESANPSVRPSSNFENKNRESSKDDKESDEKKGPQHRWQELGIGPVKILRSTNHADKFRMVQRRESTPNGAAHKVILNIPLWKEVTCKKPSDQQLVLTTVSGSGDGVTFTLKFKEAGEALAFSECIKDVCEEAKSCFA